MVFYRLVFMNGRVLKLYYDDVVYCWLFVLFCASLQGSPWLVKGHSLVWFWLLSSMLGSMPSTAKTTSEILALDRLTFPLEVFFQNTSIANGP